MKTENRKQRMMAVLLLVCLTGVIRAQEILFEDNFEKPKKWVFIDPYYMKFKKGKLHVAYEFGGSPAVYPQAEHGTSEYDGFYPQKLFCSGEVTAEWIKYKSNEKANVGYGIGYHPYSFEIKPDGSYQIYKYHSASKATTVIFSSEGKPVEGINPGAAVNKIKVERNNDIFLFYCNDKLIKKFRSTEEYRTLSVAFTLVVHGAQELTFDDYVIRTVAPLKKEEPEGYKAPAECKKGVRSAEEAMYDAGTLSDNDIQLLPPEKQLVDFFSQYGICMKINPLWVRNKKNVIGSTIALYKEDLQNLSATFPFLSKMPGSLHLTLALNSRTPEETLKMYENLTQTSLKNYLRTISKDMPEGDWESKWKSQLIKTEPLTTASGLEGTVLINNEHTVVYVSPDLLADLSDLFNLVYIIPQPGGKVIQCTVQFENKKFSQKNMPANPLERNVFTAQDEAQLISFFKAMFKSIAVSN